jgi:hypothetical protein
MAMTRKTARRRLGSFVRRQGWSTAGLVEYPARTSLVWGLPDNVPELVVKTPLSHDHLDHEESGLRIWAPPMVAELVARTGPCLAMTAGRGRPVAHLDRSDRSRVADPLAAWIKTAAGRSAGSQSVMSWPCLQREWISWLDSRELAGVASRLLSRLGQSDVVLGHGDPSTTNFLFDGESRLVTGIDLLPAWAPLEVHVARAGLQVLPDDPLRLARGCLQTGLPLDRARLVEALCVLACLTADWSPSPHVADLVRLGAAGKAADLLI